MGNQLKWLVRLSLSSNLRIQDNVLRKQEALLKVNGASLLLKTSNK